MAAILAGLRPVSNAAMESPVNNNQVYQKVLVLDQESNSFKDNDEKILLAKTGDSRSQFYISSKMLQPNPFPTGRPIRNVPGVNPHPQAPKLVPGTGAGANPAGAGGGGGAVEFDDQSSISENQKSQESKVFEYDYRSKKKKKKKKSAEQCQLDENGKEKKEEKQIPTSEPTKKLSRKSVKKHIYLTKPIQQVEFLDWEGETKLINGRELTQAVFGHGYEAGTSGKDDLVECPIQPDLNKYQRKNCSRITDETARNFSDRIIEVTSVKTDNRIKFERPMPYYDTEMETGYLDIPTGDCFFYHKNERGKFWSYKKYSPKEVADIVSEVESSFKSATNSSNFNSEL